MRQSQFKFAQTPLFHGGEIARGRRKNARPLSSKRPLHLVLKAARPIRAHQSLFRNKLFQLGEKFQIRIYSSAVAADHVHLVLKISGRRQYAAFIRSYTSYLARTLGKGLWKLLPFTRVASWGSDFRGLLRYLEQNRREASGEWEFRPRKNCYEKYL